MLENLTPRVIDSGLSVRVVFRDASAPEQPPSPPPANFWGRVKRDFDPNGASYTMVICEIRQRYVDLRRALRNLWGR